MSNSFFHVENDVTIVNRMLDDLAKKYPQHEPTLIFNNLRPKHTLQLLDLPLNITFDLAYRSGGDKVRILAEQIWQAEANGNLNVLAESANRLNQYLMAVASLPAAGNASIHIEDLALCLTNYVLLRHALYRFLKAGSKNVELPWTDTINWSEMPRGNRVAFFLSMQWPAIVVLQMTQYLARVGRDYSKFNHLHNALLHPVVPIVLENESDTSNETLGHAIGLHRNNQDYYRLWLRFFYDGKKEFYFEPIWSGDLPYLQTLIELLADIELEARDMSGELSSLWEDLTGSLEYAPNDQGSPMDVHVDFKDSRTDPLLKYRKGPPFFKR